MRASWAFGAAFIVALTAGGASAQSGAEFFKGKTVSYIVPTDPGGGYDTNGRLVAEFMEKYLPGSTFVVRNMPGAGQILGTNFLAASKPDGLTIGTFNTGLIYNQLIDDAAIKFDLNEMSYIGKVAADPRAIIVSAKSGIDSFEGLASLPAPVKFATCGISCVFESTMLIETLDLPIELVTGYNGNEDQLAMRRGEVAGVIGSRSSFEQFVADGNGKFIAQIGGTQTDTPQLADLADDAAGQAIELAATQAEIARMTAGPAGIPEDRLEALRDAYRAATSDPEFIKKAAAMKQPVEPLVGTDVQNAVIGALDQTPEMVEILKGAVTRP